MRARKILEPVVGTYSVILLDEAPHLEQRKLLLPAFHGDKMQKLTGLMEELAEREVESWPEPGRLSSFTRASRRSRSRSSCAPSSDWTPANGSKRCETG